ncbi:MAG TPA: TetR/AcrR family transcriptional regulator [Steroidobacteraceae bacterium]|jgi:TetR/AcrR family transcriptional repressor of nem operon
MARPRQFNEQAVLDAALARFWSHGYEATSTRDLARDMGITGASLYNAFGDKRGLYRRVLEHYIEKSLGERLRRYASLPPRRALATFFKEIVQRSVIDPQRKGCLLVNSALELSPHDAEFQQMVSEVFQRIESFFYKCIKAGQADLTITRARSARDLARLLLGVLLGIRVLARSRPERPLLEAAARSALQLVSTGRPNKSDCRRG